MTVTILWTICWFLVTQETLYALAVYAVTNAFLEPSPLAVMHLCRRMVSLIWLLGTLPYAVQTITNPFFQADPWGTSSASSIKCMMSAALYYGYELFIGAPACKLQGMLAIISFWWLASFKYAHYYGAWFFVLYEATTPILHILWFLRQAGMPVQLMQQLFLLMFGLARLGFGGLVTYKILRSNFHPALLLLLTTLYTTNIRWMVMHITQLNSINQ